MYILVVVLLVDGFGFYYVIFIIVVVVFVGYVLKFLRNRSLKKRKGNLDKKLRVWERVKVMMEN